MVIMKDPRPFQFEKVFISLIGPRYNSYGKRCLNCDLQRCKSTLINLWPQQVEDMHTNLRLS